MKHPNPVKKKKDGEDCIFTFRIKKNKVNKSSPIKKKVSPRKTVNSKPYATPIPTQEHITSNNTSNSLNTYTTSANFYADNIAFNDILDLSNDILNLEELLSTSTYKYCNGNSGLYSIVYTNITPTIHSQSQFAPIYSPFDDYGNYY